MIRAGLLGLAVFASAGVAQPVTYSFNGVGTGDLAGLTFADTSFEITLTGDLGDISTTGTGNPLFVDSAATFSVSGVGSGTFLVDISIVRNLSSNVFVLGDWTNNDALAVMDNPEFVGYNLTAPFGPVTDFTPGATNQFSGIGTTAGGLSIQQMSSLTYRAIPAPGALGVLGLGGLIAARRRRKTG